MTSQLRERIAGLVDEAYTSRPFTHDPCPDTNLDDAVTSWVTIMQRAWNQSAHCECAECPDRPRWATDLMETYEAVGRIRELAHDAIRRELVELFTAYAEAHPEAPWAPDEEASAA